MTFEMTKEEISKAIVECEERLKCLREELNKPECNGKRWKPKMGEEYWVIALDGQIRSYPWYDNGCDNDSLDIGNVFPTFEVAEFEVERRKVIAELSDYAEGEDAVWDGNQCHYLLYYDSTTNCIEVNFNQSSKGGCLYFPSVEVARAAIKAVGEERIKKFYLGVKE